MENKKTAVLKIKYADIIMGVLFVALAAWIFWVCRSDGLDFYHDNAPGPGFMPMISAAMIAVCGVGITIKAVMALRKNDPEGEKPIAVSEEWKTFFLIIGVCFASMFLAEILGLIITVTLAMIVLIRFLETEKWSTSIIVGVATGIVIYLIFVVFLKVHVPRGPLGF